MTDTPQNLVKKIPIVGLDGKPLTEEQADANSPLPFQDFDIYQMLAEKYNVTPDKNRLMEILTGLSEELGEFMGYHKRMLRGDYPTPEAQADALYSASRELGDMLWYMSAWATIHHIKLGDIAYGNLEKLEKRHAKKMLHGSGDTREEDSTIEGESSPVESETTGETNE